jgi:uncharacterized membrane protein SirB2
MSAYLIIRELHVLCALLSIASFIVRGVLKFRGSPLLQQKWLRISPHIVDTVLLLSAVALVVMRGEYPFVSAWLTAKTLGVFVYIGLGVVALRAGKTPAIRATAFVLAIATFAYIAMVAVTKSACPFSF